MSVHSIRAGRQDAAASATADSAHLPWAAARSIPRRGAYHDKGLEVVAFSFEEAEQLANPSRLRAFVAQYGIEYPVLLAGLPSTAPATLPQVEHLDAFPTTLFLGRDGRLRATYAGFPSAASGAFYRQAREEITATVERLLLETGRE